MNYKTRGRAQDHSLVFRCCAEDKAALKKKASELGVTMSEIIRKLLIENEYIQPSYEPHTK